MAKKKEEKDVKVPKAKKVKEEKVEGKRVPRRKTKEDVQAASFIIVDGPLLPTPPKTAPKP